MNINKKNLRINSPKSSVTQNLKCWKHNMDISYIYLKQDRNSRLACFNCSYDNKLDYDYLVKISELLEKNNEFISKNIPPILTEHLSNQLQSENIKFSQKIGLTREIEQQFDYYTKQIISAIEKQKKELLLHIENIENSRLNIFSVYNQISSKNEIINLIHENQFNPITLNQKLTKLINDKQSVKVFDQINIEQALNKHNALSKSFDMENIKNQLEQILEKSQSTKMFKEDNIWFQEIQQQQLYEYEPYQQLQNINSLPQNCETNLPTYLSTQENENMRINSPTEQKNIILLKDNQQLQQKKQEYSQKQQQLTVKQQKQHSPFNFAEIQIQIPITQNAISIQQQQSSDINNINQQRTSLQQKPHMIAEELKITSLDQLTSTNNLSSHQNISINLYCLLFNQQKALQIKDSLQNCIQLNQLYLNLNFSQISNYQFQMILHGIQNMTQLTNLTLWVYENSIIQGDIICLSQTIKSFSQLTHLGLNLGGNKQIQDEGITHLIDVIKQKQNLTYLALYLPSTNTTDKTVISFSLALLSLKNITSLGFDFSSNNIADQAIYYLTQSIQLYKSQLNEIYLSLQNNQITDQGLQYIVQSLSTCINLRILKLWLDFNVNITDYGKQQFIECRKQIQNTFKYIDLRKSEIIF